MNIVIGTSVSASTELLRALVAPWLTSSYPRLWGPILMGSSDSNKMTEYEVVIYRRNKNDDIFEKFVIKMYKKFKFT